jgi:RNA polymerase sigma-70 factor, ECF subfamily
MPHYRSMPHADVNNPSDAELVAAAQRDPAAFGAIYERYRRRVFAYTVKRVHSYDDAEDVTQETFINAFDALPRYQERGSPYLSYLFTVALNLIRRRSRQAARFVDATVPVQVDRDPLTNPEPHVIARIDSERVCVALAALPERYAIVLRCKAHGLTNPEIASGLNTSEGAVKMLYLRAKASARERLTA